MTITTLDFDDLYGCRDCKRYVRGNMVLVSEDDPYTVCPRCGGILRYIDLDSYRSEE